MTDTMQGLNKEQLDAVQTINGPMLILAGAGKEDNQSQDNLTAAAARRRC